MTDFNQPYPDDEVVRAIQAARARWWTAQGDWYDDYALDLRARLNRMGLGVQVFDGILEAAIREGRPALDLARLFDGYLGLDQDVRVSPGQFYRPKFTQVKDEDTGRLREVQVPYTYRMGPNDPPTGNVGYNAFRLARTEMAQLFHKATVESAKNAPWLRGFKWQLSNTHASRLSKWSRPAPRGVSRRLKKAIFRDICDTWAEQDIDGLGAGMYRPDGSTLPQDHPNGLCTILKITLGDDEWLDKLRRRRLERLGVAYPADQALDKATYERLRDSVLTSLKEGKKPPLALDADGFPFDPDKLEVVRSLGGSTGAKLMRDPVSGKLFVQKRGASAEHLREEALADAAYRALGVRVPAFKVYDTPQGPVKLAEFIEGQSLKEFMAAIVSAQNPRDKINKMFAEIQKDFVADALLGNWDVAGLDLDNILIDKQGHVWRIDNGGALRFRAQGGRKGDGWSAYPDELWTMRDKRVNQSAHTLFYGVGFDDVVQQIDRLARKQKALLETLPGGELRDVMAQRLDALKDVAKTAKTLNGDQWSWDYADGFTRHVIGLQQAGVVEAFPERLKHNGVVVRDENNVEWDQLRGPDSAIYQLSRYMQANGGDYGIVQYWMGKQAGSSWSGASQAVKWWIAQQRSGDTSPYYWHSGPDKARQHYEGAVAKLGKQKYDDTMQMWHAFNYELVRKVNFERNNRRGGYLELVRTEPDAVLRNYGVARGAQGATMLRGACESASIFQTVVVAGAELTLQRVPYHRVFGAYFYERSPGTRLTPFYGDNENEIVFIPEGIPFDYVGSTQTGLSTSKFW